ncbi:transglutaminaseTgpA domain-containing protein [Lapillicoccus jejuensis]|uniref:transglutaminase family protein n=1 Tax=Lapillicoccus jejuensis TaxID=402171 RepID=UPI0014777C09|nr:transglutaminase domain-containing protein [Lapillicoccus jejuensis]
MDAAVALLASMCAVFAVTTLTTPASWLAPAFWCSLVAVLVGAGLRRLTSRSLLVLLGQLVVGAYVVFAVTVPGSLRGGLPWTWTAEAVDRVGIDVTDVVTRYAAPIPSTFGITAMLVAAAVLLTIVVDFLAVTREAPAAAGLPLLAAFLAAVANSGAALGLGYFVLVALSWLLLVSRTTSAVVRRWSTAAATPRTPTADPETEPGVLSGLGASARKLGVVAVAAAVLLPVVLPHLPTRFVLDGLGQDDGAVGRGGRVGFSSTLDLSRSLQSGSLNPVLTFRTDAPGTPPPLRVVVAPEFVDGQWRTTTTGSDSRTLVGAARISSQVLTRDRRVQVSANTLDAPHLATIQPVVSADLGSTAWSADQQTGDLFVRSKPDDYVLAYREVTVSADQLREGIPGGDSGASDPQVQASRALDPGSAQVVRETTAQVTKGATSPWESAVKIQDYLRGTAFTYSLQLLPAPTRADGRQETDPVVAFLETKQGYCVQFATAMVMMARAAGIPARMAIGFLPGTFEQGQWTVRAADAHAWPELYFPGAGWLRFEPTPAERTGSTPSYAQEPTGGATTAPNRDPEATQSATGTAAPTTNRRPDVDPTTGAVLTPSVGDRLRGWVTSPAAYVVLAILLGLLGSLVLPVTARLLHRRRRERAPDPATRAEAEWQELVSRLGDLGLRPPSGGTPREWARHYVVEGYLDEQAEESMGRVVTTLERGRYARPGSALDDRHPDVESVARAAARGRPVSRRVRAFLAPRAAVAWWSGLGSRVAALPRRALSGVVARLPRRGR